MSKSFEQKTVFEDVYDLVRQVPYGKVVTYGDIAKVIAINPRYVGYILHHNPYPGDVPCHRVVNAAGKAAGNFAFGGGLAQEKLLDAEGVIFLDHRLNLTKYRHVY